MKDIFKTVLFRGKLFVAAFAAVTIFILNDPELRQGIARSKIKGFQGG